jgi:hypothetical protein
VPRIMAGDDEARDLVCKYFPIAGTGVAHVLGIANGFDTDEKWVEIFVMAPHPTQPGLRCLTANGTTHKTRLYIDYDIVNKVTGDVIYRVRQ